MSKIRYVTGIGSRTVPDEIKPKVVEVARMLYARGYTLRSGGAAGMDSLFEEGFPDRKEIYLPWKRFNNNNSSFYEIKEEAMRIASSFHPNWNNLKNSVKKLHSRNVYQILGYDLNIPSSLVLVYTKDGCTSNKTRTKETGGSAQAISIADFYNIPIINLKNKYWEYDLAEFIEETTFDS